MGRDRGRSAAPIRVPDADVVGPGGCPAAGCRRRSRPARPDVVVVGGQRDERASAGRRTPPGATRCPPRPADGVHQVEQPRRRPPATAPGRPAAPCPSANMLRLRSSTTTTSRPTATPWLVALAPPRPGQPEDQRRPAEDEGEVGEPVGPAGHGVQPGDRRRPAEGDEPPPPPPGRGPGDERHDDRHERQPEQLRPGEPDRGEELRGRPPTRRAARTGRWGGPSEFSSSRSRLRVGNAPPRTSRSPSSAVEEPEWRTLFSPKGRKSSARGTAPGQGPRRDQP